MADKPKKQNSVIATAVRKPITFEDRECVRLDDDVKLLLNSSAQKVHWESKTHAINAGLRIAMKNFAPPTIRIRIHPFDQLAFAKKRKIRSKARK